MEFQVFLGLMIPFVGTVAGAAAVFFLNKMSDAISSVLGGFAAGVMIAASVWSLLIPAMQWGESLGAISAVPAVVGFLLGVGFFLLLDKTLDYLYTDGGGDDVGVKAKSHTMLTLAVAMHNLPEGVAVGVIYAWLLAGQGGISATSALALAIGVGIQNFPEGAIISLPCAAVGGGRMRAFAKGALSAAVELVGALLALMLTGALLPMLPYLLGFAAGAMIYVVVEELIPTSSQTGGKLVTVFFALGFALMMTLDVVLG